MLQKLLLKALLDMPSTAFLLSSFLIPERFAERKEVLSVQHLHSLLEGCRFKEFWEAEELKEVRTSTPIPGLEASARNFGYGVLSSSHQKYVGFSLLGNTRFYFCSCAHPPKNPFNSFFFSFSQVQRSSGVGGSGPVGQLPEGLPEGSIFVSFSPSLFVLFFFFDGNPTPTFTNTDEGHGRD